VAGTNEHNEIVTDLVVGQRATRRRVGGRDQSVHQRRIPGRIGVARLQDVVGDLADGRRRGACPAPLRGWQPFRCADRRQPAVRNVCEHDAQWLGERVGAFIEVEPEYRSTQRPQRQPAAFCVEVDFAGVRPAVGDRVCGPGHLAAEVADAVLGKDRLQRAPAGQPSVMGNDEKVRPQQLSHFLMDLISFHKCVRTSEMSRTRSASWP